MFWTPNMHPPFLPVLGRRKRLGLAAVIGFLTGGIGLALYFRSIRDLFPVEVAVGLALVSSIVAGVNPLYIEVTVAAVVGGLYGFLRAQSSNRRLAASLVPAAAVGSAG